jgi:hypothetical protein
MADNYAQRPAEQRYAEQRDADLAEVVAQLGAQSPHMAAMDLPSACMDDGGEQGL